MRPVRTSIRWRLVLIYFLMVFAALTVVSVYLQNRIEDYQISALQENINSTIAETKLIESLGKYEELSSHGDEISEYLESEFALAFGQEISIVTDQLYICASGNESLRSRSASGIFDVGLIAECLSTAENAESDSVTSEGIPVKNLCYAILNPGNRVTGIAYVRVDLSSITAFTAQSKLIFIQAILIALLVAVALGIVMSASITVPITEVTKNVQRMGRGDFSGEVPVKSGDEIGQLAEMFNLMRRRLDITLTEISQEKNKLETILKYMADSLIAVDLNGNIQHANPAACRILNVEEADLPKYNYESLLGHMSPQLEFSVLLENSRSGGMEITIDYGAMTFAVRYDRYKNESGEDLGIIILMEDITERQKLEDMQTDFVANVSHELKTPLTNIKSYTETLLDGAIDDREVADHFLSIIDSEADRMNRLVRDLLQLSRLDHSQERWNIKEGNLIPLLALCVEKMSISARQKHQQLNSLFNPDGSLRILMDRDRMEQVIINIISNAVKYTDEGGRVDVDAFIKDGMVNIVVSDNGIGIPAESIDRIFERFYRVDKARSRAMGGTGLGLAITRQIVEELHGTIHADSVEGSGTTITIMLPPASRRGIANIE